MPVSFVAFLFIVYFVIETIVAFMSKSALGIFKGIVCLLLALAFIYSSVGGLLGL